jgi:hypothetical protein
MYFANFFPNTAMPTTTDSCELLVPEADANISLHFYRFNPDNISDSNVYQPIDTFSNSVLDLVEPTSAACDRQACLAGPCLLWDMDYTAENLLYSTNAGADRMAGEIAMVGIPRCGPFFGLQMVNRMDTNFSNVVPSTLGAATEALLLTKTNVEMPDDTRILPIPKAAVNANPIWYYSGTGREQQQNREYDRNLAVLSCDGKGGPYGEAHSQMLAGPWGADSAGNPVLFGQQSPLSTDVYSKLANSDAPAPITGTCTTCPTPSTCSTANCSAVAELSATCQVGWTKNCTDHAYPPYAFRTVQLIPAGGDQIAMDLMQRKLFEEPNLCDTTQCMYVPSIPDADVRSYLGCILLELLLLAATTNDTLTAMLSTNYTSALPPSCFSNMQNNLKTPTNMNLNDFKEYINNNRSLAQLLKPQSTLFQSFVPHPDSKLKIDPAPTCTYWSKCFSKLGKNKRTEADRQCCYGTYRQSRVGCHEKCISGAELTKSKYLQPVSALSNDYWRTDGGNSDFLTAVYESNKQCRGSIAGVKHVTKISFGCASSSTSDTWYGGNITVCYADGTKCNKIIQYNVPKRKCGQRKVKSDEVAVDEYGEPTQMNCAAPSCYASTRVSFTYSLSKSGNTHYYCTQQSRLNCVQPTNVAFPICPFGDKQPQCSTLSSVCDPPETLPQHLVSADINLNANGAASLLQVPYPDLNINKFQCMFPSKGSRMIKDAFRKSKDWVMEESPVLTSCAENAPDNIFNCFVSQTLTLTEPETDGSSKVYTQSNPSPRTDVMARLIGYAALALGTDSTMVGFDAAVQTHKKWEENRTDWKMIGDQVALHYLSEIGPFRYYRDIEQMRGNKANWAVKTTTEKNDFLRKEFNNVKNLFKKKPPGPNPITYQTIHEARTLPDQWTPAPMTAVPAFSRSDSATQAAPCDCGLAQPLYKTLGFVSMDDPTVPAFYKTLHFSEVESSKYAWFVEMGYGWDINTDLVSQQDPMGLYIPSNPRWASNLSIYERDFLDVDDVPDAIRRFYTNDIAPNPNDLKNLLFNGADPSPTLPSVNFKVTTIVFEQGSCMRWPYGAFPRMSMNPTDQTKYFGNASDDNTYVVGPESQVGYCETHGGKYFHCVNDALQPSEREAFCAKPAATRMVIGAGIRGQTVGTTCDTTHKTCLIIPGSPDVADINGLTGNLENYTILISPFNWTVAVGLFGPNRYSRLIGGDFGHQGGISTINISDTSLTGVPALSDDELGMLINNTLSADSIIAHMDAIVEKINCPSEVTLPWISDKPLTCADIFPPIAMYGQRIQAPNMTVQAASTKIPFRFQRTAVFPAGAAPACSQFLVSARLFTLIGGVFNQTNCGGMPALDRAPVVFGGNDVRNASLSLSTSGAEMPVAFVGDYTSSFPKAALANIGVASIAFGPSLGVEYAVGGARANGTVVLSSADTRHPVLIQPYATTDNINFTVIPEDWPIINISKYTALFGSGRMHHFYSEKVAPGARAAVGAFVALVVLNMGFIFYFGVYLCS